MHQKRRTWRLAVRRSTLRRRAAPVSHTAKSHKDGQSSTVLWNLQNEHQFFERARTQMVKVSYSTSPRAHIVAS